jgi:hypothetical protein
MAALQLSAISMMQDYNDCDESGVLHMARASGAFARGSNEFTLF